MSLIFLTINDLITSALNTHREEVLLIENNNKYYGYNLALCLAQITQLFVEQDIKPGSIIIILLPRGLFGSLAIYSVLFYGCTYLPIDINQPENRIQFIINDAKPHAIIGLEHRPIWLNDNIKWININLTTIQNKNKIHNPYQNKIDPESIAAILYTSGSTGNPKGIALSHRAVLAFVKWSIDIFAVNNKDNIANLAPFHFDLSTFDLFVPLVTGAKLHFMPQSLTMSPLQITNWIKAKNISIWYTVPSILSFWARKGNLIKEALPSLRLILFAGEPFPVNQLMCIANLLKKTSFYNLYGPTETNVCCFWKVDPHFVEINQKLPIGYKTPYVSVKKHTDNNTLLVSGDSLFSGYWQEGKLNQKLNKMDYFDTNDLIQEGQLGELYYLGRKDRMIKYYGYRIEPCEIENIINNYTNVIGSVVRCLNINEHYYLIAYIAFDGEKPLESLLAEYLNKNLPKYMCPTKYILNNYMPRLTNGKTDLQQIDKIIWDKYGYI